MSRKSRSQSGKQRQKKTKPTPAPPWKRALLWAGGIATTLLIATVTALGTGFGYDLYGIFSRHVGGSPTPADSPALGDLSVTESHGNYQFITPISNEYLVRQQVQRININVRWIQMPRCNEVGLSTYTYKINHKISLLSRDTIAGIVTPTSGIGAESSVWAIGKLTRTCGYFQLVLAFRPPALILVENTTTYIVINLPMKILAKSLDAGSENIIIPNFIVHPFPVNGNINLSGNYGYMTATVTFNLSSGKQTFKCKISSNSIC